MNTEQTQPTAPVDAVVHTPGPWTVDDLGDRSFEETNHKWGIGAASKPTYRVAKVEGLGRQSEVDARLIAAAPEMLAVLRDVALPPYRDSDLASLLETLRVRAKSVISKIV